MIQHRVDRTSLGNRAYLHREKYVYDLRATGAEKRSCPLSEGDMIKVFIILWVRSRVVQCPPPDSPSSCSTPPSYPHMLNLFQHQGFHLSRR
jgi:hypothetical protein